MEIQVDLAGLFQINFNYYENMVRFFGWRSREFSTIWVPILFA